MNYSSKPCKYHVELRSTQIFFRVVEAHSLEEAIANAHGSGGSTYSPYPPESEVIDVKPIDETDNSKEEQE